MLLRRLLLLLIGLVLPPLSVALGQRPIQAAMNAALFLAGLVIFFFFFAGPGFVMILLSVFHACIVALFGPLRVQAGAEQAAS